jgi:hypothetical protein
MKFSKPLYRPTREVLGFFAMRQRDVAKTLGHEVQAAKILGFLAIVPTNNRLPHGAYYQRNSTLVTPTDATDATLTVNGFVPAVNITTSGTFTVDGGGNTGGDEVDVQGTNAGTGFIADEVHRTVLVSDAAGVNLLPVHLAADVQIAGLLGGNGNNSFLVAPVAARSDRPQSAGRRRRFPTGMP